MNFFDTDEIYRDRFDKTYRFTKEGLSGNPEKDMDTLEKTIKTLFDYQGLDWIGRGEIFLAKNQASIAAVELVLHELKAAIKK